MVLIAKMQYHIILAILFILAIENHDCVWQSETTFGLKLLRSAV